MQKQFNSQKKRQKHFKNTVMKSITIAVLALFLMAGNCSGPATVDRPASDLGVKITVIDSVENPSDGKVPVVMQFFSQGNFVKLSGNATVTCNGVPLVDNGLGNAARVSLQPQGGTYIFQHSRNNVNTTVNVAVAPRPVFQTPTTAGATVPRNNNLVIHYVAGVGSAVRGSATDGTNSKNNSQPDDGTHEGMDVSAFNAGAGELGLVRTLTDTQHSGGSGFANVESKYETGKRIDITWQ